jgi:hypothetical protein
VECFRYYDASTWNANLVLLDAGIKLLMEMLRPALLLSIIGSLLPTSPTVGEHIPVGGLPPFIHVFSPYTFPSLALSAAPQTCTPSSSKYDFEFDLSYFMRCLALSVMSPSAIDVLFHKFSPILIQTLARLRVMLMSRKGPDRSTKEALAGLVRVGRAIRRQSYDLYLPPQNNSDSTKREFISSILFFPGFGVDHSAYADVASRISDSGIPVAVVSLEPLRLAHKNLGGSLDDVKRLIQVAGEDLIMHYKRFHADGKFVFEWSLGGHSMGGYNALQLAESLKKNLDMHSVLLRDGSKCRIGSNIIAWAAGTVAQSFPDLCDASSLRVLILLASGDPFASISSPQQRHLLLSKLPKRTRFVTIRGGNHSGFASYDEASKTSGINGPRRITLESQQAEASRLTTNFLLRK